MAGAKIMKRTQPKIIELNVERVQRALQHAEAALHDEDYEIIRALADSYAYITDLVGEKNITIRRLRKMLFGASTEKSEAVIGKGKHSETSSSPGKDGPAQSSQENDPKNHASSPRKGHGRNGADAYRGAEKIRVPHESLKPGDACPDCQEGTVYEVARPAVLVRIKGQAPVAATVYQLQKMRCNLCGKVFTAQTPEGVGSRKYDATAGSMIALLKYGSGMPFNRMQGLQGNLGIPLPASTQWDIVHAQARHLEPVYVELLRQAGQGDVVYNDDTTIKILELMGKRAQQHPPAEDLPGRSGMFTSGIVSMHQGRKIALFFSGRKHAGENLADVLAQRATTLEPPIQMCDALSRNLPAELETIVANCLAHGRRQFVDVVDRFPEECRYVLEVLKEVYKNDAIARERGLSPEARLQFHQTKSSPIMKKLHDWLTQQFDDRRVEPNSALGQAISYMLNHWEKLTLFLQKPGAPLDNNVCEQALKRAILHRKNALFYKTLNGAHVGDMFMSLIHTCHLNDVNTFDYLTELQRHAGDLAAQPENWMPWNYRDTLSGEPSPSSPTS